MTNLRDIRRTLNLSQAELASAMGVTQSALSQYETGRCQPLIKHARRLIAFAEGQGVLISLDDVYAGAPELAETKEA